MEDFNIVELIENNPITRLTDVYQHKLINKIKESFADDEQKMFVASFYCLLNYKPKEDFVVDLDDIWRWVGFSNKAHAKTLLYKRFVVDKDYQILLTQPRKQTKPLRGGHNKEFIMMTVDTFKKFCLKADTKKADQIHDYYIKLEGVLQDVLLEESTELKNQLEQKTIDKDKIREKTIIEYFQNNIQCVYYGIVDNVSDNNEKLIKFGNSNNLKTRIAAHKDTYTNFRLINAFKVDNKLQIENAIKENPLFAERIRTITIKGKNYVELLVIDGLSFTELDKTIKDIISTIDFTPENYKKLLEENRLLKSKLETNADILSLISENKHLQLENLKLRKKINGVRFKDSIDPVIETKELEDYYITMHNLRPHRTHDGKYTFNGKTYDKIIGSRQEVWDGISYKTTGGLIKDDFMINRLGKIVSKKKHAQETIADRFRVCGVNK
jgi:hypothetical protein